MKSQTQLQKSSQLTSQGIAKNTKNIKSAFPTLDRDFYRILFERIEFYKWDDKKLTRAVNYVIDNCTYPNPTIANFIQAEKDFENDPSEIKIIQTTLKPDQR